MLNLTRARADQQYAATQEKAKQVAKEKEKSQQEIMQRMANLKALRLAKEAEDRETVEKAAAEKAPAQRKETLRSPQGH